MNRMRFFHAALTSAALSLLFLVVYSGCNSLTAWRSDVGTIAFAWERHIPFVPLMIVPYMSIDAFFVVAPFLCASDAERRRLAWQITMAVLVAGVFFLLFPLRFAFDRPPAGTGLLGAVFDWFRAMDLPYNLAPSLHIALRTILAEHYHRHSRGWLRGALHVWFVLIGLSTVLVWQHHLVDVALGFVLGAFCLLAWPEGAPARRAIPNRRIAVYYAGAALATLALGWTLRPWGIMVLWPTLALGVVAAAYAGFDVRVYPKREGRLPWMAKLAFAPVLVGQWLSLRYYRRQCTAWDEVTSGVHIGRVLSDEEAALAVAGGVTAVLDLTGEFDEARPFRELRYSSEPVLDLTAPTQEQLTRMAEIIARESARGVIYVHCKIGYSRSAAAIAAWMLATGRAGTARQAIELVQAVRPSIVVRGEVRRALEAFAAGKARRAAFMLAT